MGLSSATLRSQSRVYCLLAVLRTRAVASSLTPSMWWSSIVVSFYSNSYIKLLKLIRLPSAIWLALRGLFWARIMTRLCQGLTRYLSQDMLLWLTQDELRTPYYTYQKDRNSSPRSLIPKVRGNITKQCFGRCHRWQPVLVTSICLTWSASCIICCRCTYWRT